jgi:hypothetical protein
MIFFDPQRWAERCSAIPKRKWGFVEAATCAVRLRAYRDSHIGQLYQRLQPGTPPEISNRLCSRV